MGIIGFHDIWRMDGPGLAGYIAIDVLGRGYPNRAWIHIPRGRFESFEEDIVALLAERIRCNPEEGGDKDARISAKWSPNHRTWKTRSILGALAQSTENNTRE